jgi:transposase
VTQPATPPAAEAPAIFLGIDVAKDHLDLARSDQPKPWRCPNTPAGIQTLVQELLTFHPAGIVVEATGGWERTLTDALLEAQLPVALVNPERVRHLAKALGILAKTDAIDAAVLARFAQLAAPRLLIQRTKVQVELDALVTCRRQLIKSRTEQTNRRQMTVSRTAQKALDKIILALNHQILNLDKKIQDHIDGDGELKTLAENLTSVPGVGPGLASALIALLPELGKIDHRPLAALVGVAPVNHDSGGHTGHRAIRGGRPAIRSVLYMATLAAKRFNPVIKRLAERLEQAGKPGKVIVVACMHKLLTLLNVIARDQIAWSQLECVKNG